MKMAALLSLAPSGAPPEGVFHFGRMNIEHLMPNIE
jgi:hypothetical protein